MSLRFSLLAGAALIAAPAISAQSVSPQHELTGGSPVASVSTSEIFLGGDPITLTQSTSLKVERGMVACASSADGYTTENSYWRVFDLAAEGVASIALESVLVGVSPPAGGSIDSLQVSFYTLPTGTDVTSSFPAADLTFVSSTELFEAEESETPEPFDLAASGTFTDDALFVVELFIPTGDVSVSGDEANTDTRGGANDAGESGPTYLSSASCAITDPVTTGSIGFDGGLVLAVTGVPATDAEGGPAGEKITLGSAQPNPVANAAKMPFTLEVASDVQVGVYDLLGRQVTQLTNRSYGAGAHELSLDASDLSAGTYVVRLSTGATVVTQMVTVSR